MKLSRKEMADLLSSLKGRILITTHKNPDGDAVGSSLAWYNYLRRFGKDVQVIYHDKIPFFFDFLPNIDRVIVSDVINGNFDYALITDVSDLKRIGFDAIPADKLIVIDHHLTWSNFGDYSTVEPNMSSACELSLEIMKLIDESRIDLNVSLPLYTGMVTDTGSFSYSNTSVQTHRNAAYLMERGVKPYFVTKNLFERNRINRFKLLELVLNTLSFAVDSRVAYIVLYRDFLRRTGAYVEESEGFISYPRSISGVEVSVFFKEVSDALWKVSLRSKGKVDVSAIAGSMGGGGHRMASGFEYHGSLSELKVILFKKIELSLEAFGFNEMSR